MTRDKKADHDLEQMFEQARGAVPEPSPDFLARVLSDAEAMQPAPAGVMRRPALKRTRLGELFAGFGDAIGGWPAFAGLGVAAVTGLFIGISPPQGLIAPLGSALGASFGDAAALSETLDFGDGFDFTQFEG